MLTNRQKRERTAAKRNMSLTEYNRWCEERAAAKLKLSLPEYRKQKRAKTAKNQNLSPAEYEAEKQRKRAAKKGVSVAKMQHDERQNAKQRRAKIAENSRGKELAIIEDIICVYHPIRSQEPHRSLALAEPRELDVPYCLESLVARVGGLTHAAGHYMDFDDASDLKTCTVGYAASGCLIQNLENKIGDIRVIIYNELTDEIDYMFIPADDMKQMRRPKGAGKERHKMVIPVSYSVINHSYGKLDQYLVGSFLELATKRG